VSRQVGSPKGAKARADKYFSLIVRSRGECQCCGSDQFLQCAHVISRRYSHTRCMDLNAFCLCAGCHHHFTDHPVSFGIFVLGQIGEEGYQILKETSNLTGKLDWFKVAAELKARWEAIEAAA
jgi:hypothetical protein